MFWGINHTHYSMEAKFLIFSTIFFFAYVSLTAYSWEDECTYVIFVQTGNAKTATTHGTVSLELRDKYFHRFNVTNLQSKGIMGKHHNYFKRGNLDAFAVKGKCFNSPFCSMTLSHDNPGVSPGWCVEYIEVTSIAHGRGCRKIKFPVNACVTVDKPPFDSASHGVYLCDEMVDNNGSC